MKKKFYQWSDSILSACKYLGLPELPKNIKVNPEHVPLPSEFLGNDFELDQQKIAALKKSCRLSDEQYDKAFTGFRNKYKSQKIFKHNSTDLSIFFVDYLLSARKTGYSFLNYFNFELYNKPVEVQKTFLGKDHLLKMNVIFNRLKYLGSKAISNRFFADFIHRDWLDMTKCSVEDFRIFVKKHENFFAKPAIGHGGGGGQDHNYRFSVRYR